MRIGVFAALSWLSFFAFAADQKPPALFQVAQKGSYVMVREGKSDTAQLKYVLSPGQVFEAKDIGGGWLEVTFNETGGKTTKRYINTKAAGSQIVKVDNKKPVRAYVDHPQLPDRLPPGVIASEAPLYSGAHCKLAGTPCPKYVADVYDSDEMKIVGSTIQKVYDPYKDEVIYRLFYKVKFKNFDYKKIKDALEFKEGWVNADDLRTDGPYKATTLFPPAGGASKDEGDGAGICEGCKPDTGKTSPIVPIEDIQRELKTNDIDRLLEQIEPFTGECLIADNPGESPLLPASTSAFDLYMLPHWEEKVKKKGFPVDFTLANGRKVTTADWIAIDGLARTIWSEMGVCEEPYQIAVAGTIVNRAKVAGNGVHETFAKGALNDLKAPISRAIESQCQYSVWNSRKGCEKAGSEANPSLKHVLCPPAHRDAVAYTERSANDKEYGNYSQALKIAITAVLTPETFDKMISGLKGLKHYTSGAAEIKGMTRAAAPSINGEVLDKANCMVFWK